MECMCVLLHFEGKRNHDLCSCGKSFSIFELFIYFVGERAGKAAAQLYF